MLLRSCELYASCEQRRQLRLDLGDVRKKKAALDLELAVALRLKPLLLEQLFPFRMNRFGFGLVSSPVGMRTKKIALGLR